MGNNKTKRSGSFEALDPNKPIFKKIKEQKWWKLFLEDKKLYIEIRKDNYIDVYYYGGCLAKITYNEIKKKFIAKIHPKFKGLEGIRPVSLDLEKLDEKEIEEIKERIEIVYLKENKEEKILKEKRIQGEMILKYSKYIDSEFQYNKNKNSRIDLIELSDKKLSFVELKLIDDDRLNDKHKKNITKQMENYSNLINENKDKIIDYYKKIIKLKNDLGIYKREGFTDFTPNERPKLIIVNTYGEKLTPKRKNRIQKIKIILEKLKKDIIDSDSDIIPLEQI